jgi:hypothetical protein
MRDISAGNFVGHDRDNPNPAKSDHRQRYRIVAGKDEKIFRHGSANFGDLTNVAAGFFDGDDVRDLGQAQQCGRFDVRTRASRDVVQHQRLGGGFGDGLEMLINAFLRGLVVVGRRGQDVVDAGTRRDFSLPSRRLRECCSKLRPP